MPRIPAGPALALLHVTWTQAVLLIDSRSAQSRFPGFPLSTPTSHVSSSPSQEFFAAGCPTFQVDFAGSEHGLRDGNGTPHPDTRLRACPCRLQLFTIFSQRTSRQVAGPATSSFLLFSIIMSLSCELLCLSLCV